MALRCRHPCASYTPAESQPTVDALRKLYVFGDAEQRASAEKAIDDIWAGRNGWCPVR
jgi:hypothetical protein